jgi:hypothetical protein
MPSSSLLMAIGVQILVFRRGSGIAANLRGLFWIHAQNSGKREQS